MTERGPFEIFYGSSLQQPLLLWCAAIAGAAVVTACRSTSRSVRTFGLAFSAIALLDAWLTADHVMGIGALAPSVGTAVATLFVIVGDLRVFLFLEAATADGKIAVDGRGLLRASLWSLVVPVAAAAVRGLLPDAPWRGRVTFLFYELAFLGIMLGFRLRARGAAARPWGRGVILYVIGYYALWALADAVILFLHLDMGYLLRVIANVLYYGGLLATVSLLAPARAERGAARV